MARLPLVVRRRMKNVRKAEQRGAQRAQVERNAPGEELREAFTAMIPVKPELSQTEAKRIDRQERVVQERAERRLGKLDSIWGFGIGPVKARLKWMTQLLSR